MSELKFIGGYPANIRNLIKNVEKTRNRRNGNLPPQMTPKERVDILNLCHPDFVSGGKRKIKLGLNKGDIAPNEVVDQLEAYPLIEDKLDVAKPDIVTDVLIIGGGLAGTSAALLANDNGVPVDKILLVNKLRHGDANSMMAEGGTQAADRPNDSPAIHFLDALGGGHFTNKQDVLKALVNDAPEVIQWLIKMGAIFDREEDGSFVELTGGGTSRRRMHACRDYTGMEELRVIRDEFRNREIPVMEFYPVVELLTDGAGRVTGAVLYGLETGEYKIVQAKTTILATGGFGRLH
ncbi:MAG: FAD-binding protein, partial [Actinomycetia bacterium]|nr:FAD-binding protein [Actinomycetes bacterium]